MNKSLLQKIEKTLTIGLLFLLPTQLALHFWPPWSFVFGIRVDILAPSIYLTDIFIGIIFLINIFINKKLFIQLLNYKIILILFLVFGIINCIFSISFPTSVFRWLKIIEFAFLAFYFSKQEIVKFSSIVKIFFYSSILFSLIGIIQFFKSGTIGGIFYYLGERSFNVGTPGIALVNLAGRQLLRVYSTFPHPNSLAGFLGVILIFIILSGNLKKNIFNLLGILVMLMCFILTFSVSSYLGIFLIFSFYFFSKNIKDIKSLVLGFLFLSIFGSLLLTIFSSTILTTFPLLGQNISQRLDLSYIAGQIISGKFLIGSGLGTYIINIPFYKGVFVYSWLLQPVHNIYLLVFSEIGIVGLLSFCLAIYKILKIQLKKKKMYFLLPLIFILFTGLFDHYTLTLQQNTLLFSIFIGLSFHAKMA